MPHILPGGYLVPCSACSYYAECANSQAYTVLQCMGCCRRPPSTEVYAMACHECMFYPCGSGHIAIRQSIPMFLQPVFLGSTSLPNVHLRAYCAGDRVDYSLSFVHWHLVLGVNQQLAKGHQRAKHHLDV